ncbi:hypothetical protein ACTXJ3_08520 [Brachybacterium paraconglomeratum]|uniref:hypothetical protein n=1 Tax=Brachybacterium paraconglomeratum TaxID=173362 RepID=UPI003FD17F79
MISSSRTPSDRARAQIAQLFGGEQGEERAVAWARGVLEHAGLDASTAPLRSMRALRRAERRLGLVAGRFLVEAVAGRSEATGRAGAGSPLTD